jgi:hypothetical protein
LPPSQPSRECNILANFQAIVQEKTDPGNGALAWSLEGKEKGPRDSQFLGPGWEEMCYLNRVENSADIRQKFSNTFVQ